MPHHKIGFPIKIWKERAEGKNSSISSTELQISTEPILALGGCELPCITPPVSRRDRASFCEGEMKHNADHRAICLASYECLHFSWQPVPGVLSVQPSAAAQHGAMQLLHLEAEELSSRLLGRATWSWSQPFTYWNAQLPHASTSSQLHGISMVLFD